MEWIDVVSPQRIGFICIKILGLLRLAGGTRDDAAPPDSRVPAMARGLQHPPADPGRKGRPDTSVSGAVVQWCSDVKNDGISERGDWPL